MPSSTAQQREEMDVSRRQKEVDRGSRKVMVGVICDVQERR